MSEQYCVAPSKEQKAADLVAGKAAVIEHYKITEVNKTYEHMNGDISIYWHDAESGWQAVCTPHNYLLIKRSLDFNASFGQTLLNYDHTPY